MISNFPLNLSLPGIPVHLGVVLRHQPSNGRGTGAALGKAQGTVGIIVAAAEPAEVAVVAAVKKIKVIAAAAVAGADEGSVEQGVKVKVAAVAGADGGSVRGSFGHRLNSVVGGSGRFLDREAMLSQVFLQFSKKLSHV